MSSNYPKIIYAGTPDFAVAGLQALVEDGRYEVVAVYTQPDRPAGRGRKLTASPVKAYALEQNIPVYQPLSLKAGPAQQELAGLNADLMVVAAYGLILPESILQAPRLGCINIHASLLPRWRGAAPIQRAILAGDSKTGITIMQMDKGLDTGDMLLKKECVIEAGQTASQLHDVLKELGAKALIEVLPALFEGKIQAQPQDNSQAVYAEKLQKKEAIIDWQQSADEIVRKILAFNSWPVAQCQLDGKTVRIWYASVIETESQQTPGKVLDAGKQGLQVATGKGTINISEMQMPGKRKMAVSEMINSYDFSNIVFQ